MQAELLRGGRRPTYRSLRGDLEEQAEAREELAGLEKKPADAVYSDGVLSGRLAGGPR